MNPIIQIISTKAAEDIVSLIAEGEADILTAIHKAQAEAQAQETNPKFSLGFKISVDLDKGEFNCDLSWSVKQSLGTSHKLEDVNQISLPINN